MTVSRPIRSALLFTSTFLFPAVGFPLVSYAWWIVSGRSWPFVIVVMGVPVLFGYIMPGVLTGVIKRWRFTTGPRVGSYYVHHGFVYGSKLAFALLMVVRSLDGLSALDVAAIVLVTGAATAFGGWFHDVQAVRAGKIEITDGVEALANFAPPSYFAMGGTYAAVSLASHQVLAVDPAALLWVFPAALVTMCLLPSLVFLAVDPPARHALKGLLARAPRSTFKTGG
ncbi:MAG: hypothetical protein ABI665_04800 [Vicinamibacterales bacterium]